MNIISKNILYAVAGIVCLLLMACDHQGPWSYYPEETEIYKGVYTYGHIVAGESPRVCFSKVYELEEASAEKYAFFDSAKVTVKNLEDSQEVELIAEAERPNCFGVGTADADFKGVAGGQYEMNAYFVWDSAGHKAKSQYKAVANIPTKFRAVTVQGPSRSLRNSNPHLENNHEYLEFEFLEYPYDVNTYNISMDYDGSVRGVISTIVYDDADNGESQNTTMLNMLKSFLDKDSMGYYGMSMKASDETEARMGFTRRQNVAGKNTLDTIIFPGMTIPIGKSKIRFYGTDQAYVDYEYKVIDALTDSRIVPESNVEMGMGVFSGMLKDSIYLDVHSDNYIKYDYMFYANCLKEDETLEQEAFGTKSCRLHRDSLCSIEAVFNRSTNVYEHFKEACVSTLAKNIMDSVTISPEVFPDYDLKKFDESMVQAKMLYCFENGFSGSSQADCESLKTDCIESSEKNECKEKLWEWCDDRNWDFEEVGGYCGTAFLSRIRLEELESSILDRVVREWCENNRNDIECKRI